MLLLHQLHRHCQARLPTRLLTCHHTQGLPGCRLDIPNCQVGSERQQRHSWVRGAVAGAAGSTGSGSSFELAQGARAGKGGGEVFQEVMAERQGEQHLQVGSQVHEARGGKCGFQGRDYGGGWR